MCNVIISVTLFALVLGCQGGNAEQKCPLPPESDLIYFDMVSYSSKKHSTYRLSSEFKSL